MTTATKYKTHSKYKPSGIDWLGDIPNGWEVKRLKYMCSRSADYGLNIEAENYLSQGIRFIRTSDVNDSGYLLEEGVYLNPDLVPFEYLLSEGDILLSRSGTIGRSYVCGHLDEKSTYAGYLVRFRSQQNKLKTRFAYYFFHSQTFFDWIKTQLIETTIGNVNGQKYANIPIQLPNLKEQQSITDFLDRETAKIDEMVAKKQKMMELLKENRQALITHAVTKGLDPKAKMKPSGIDWLGDIPEGWETKRLRFVSNYVKTGSTPDSEKQEYFDSGTIPWFTPGDFNEKIDLDNASKTITEKAIIDGEARLFKKDSILLVGIGATLGKIGFCKTEFSANQQINVIYINNQNDPRFYAYYLLAITEIVISTSNASTLGILNQEKTKQILCVVPPRQEQSRIAEFIDEQWMRFDEMMKKVEMQIEKFQEYRQALITSAVTGKIMIKNYE